MLPMNKQAQEYINGYKPHLVSVALCSNMTNQIMRTEIDFGDVRAYVHLIRWMEASAKRMQDLQKQFELLGAEFLGLAWWGKNGSERFLLTIDGEYAYDPCECRDENFRTIAEIHNNLGDGDCTIRHILQEQGHHKHEWYEWAELN